MPAASPDQSPVLAGRLVVALVAVMAVTVAGLRWSGRVWWCSCGALSPWVGDAWCAHTSQHLFDPYSFTHLLHGFLFCGILALAFPARSQSLHLLLTILIESGWELLENSSLVVERYRSVTVSIGYAGDSIANSLGDILCCTIGFFIARRLGLRLGIAVFVVTELLLLAAIRDNLTLNLIMLVYPIEAVKTWQLAVLQNLPR